MKISKNTAPINIKIEIWNGHGIRFVEINPGDWHGIAVDICKALNLTQVTRAIKNLKQDGVTIIKAIDKLGREQELNAISPKNIYRLIFKSRKKEAEEFQDWVFEVLETLRKATGLEGFQIFRMLDKEHQREAMARLNTSLAKPVRVDFIKANTISNKAVSSLFGHKKMFKKNDMTPDMLVQRQQILDDTVNLMAVKENFGLDLSVSKTIYDKYLS